MRFAQPHFKRDVQDERDKGHDVHTYVDDNINNTDRVPTNWKVFIACRQCKHKLTANLAVKMLALSPGVMTRSDQKFITAGPTEPM